MTERTKLITLASRLLSGAAVSAVAIGSVSAQSISDEIVVTAQRTEQSLQDVPIAVSAFGGEELDTRQIESLTDIQFNIPSFSFSRTAFTGSAVSLRGIASFATGATTEPSVSVHQNDVFVAAPRLFETEFFDIERLEVLRGPQGTLYGRNATAGVVNVITNKADPSEISGAIDAEYGNFNSVKVKGALNVPIIKDVLGARIAGIITKRDGFTENAFTGNDIDDRDIFAVRGSLRWVPTENTTVDFVANYMREDDNRQRATATLCNPDPVSGCVPGPLSFGGVGPDLNGTTAALSSVEAFTLLGIGVGFTPTIAATQAASFGLFSIADGPNFSPFPNSTDPRVQNFDVDPTYKVDDLVLTLKAKHDFETVSLTVNAGYGSSQIDQREDFDGTVSGIFRPPSTLESGIPAGAAFPGSPAVGGLPILANTLFAGGTLPVSAFDVDNLVGAIGGNELLRSNRFQSVSQSLGDTSYYSGEALLSTDFDSRINFLAGASYSRSEGEADFTVVSTGLDYFAAVGGTLIARAATFAGAIAQGATEAQALAAANQIDGLSAYVPFFFNDAEDVVTRSVSLFGEVYFDLTDTIKLTGGIRQNFDRKSSRERGNFLESPGTAISFLPIGTRSAIDAVNTINPFLERAEDFNATTGRAVIQWTPSDNVEAYASYTRGFKAGGFNPVASATFPGIPPVFDPENINSFEAGVKTVLADGVVRANLTGYYYDYGGLQVSNFQQQTVINENIDARVFGVEGEFVFAPTDDLVFNSTLSYLNTQITDQDFMSVNSVNPTAGVAGARVLRDLTNAGVCVLQESASDLAILSGATGSTATSLIGTSLAGVDPAFAAVDPLIASPFTSCAALTTALGSVNGALGTNFQLTPTGLPQSVDGNSLPSSPEFTVGAGAQYTFNFGNGLTLTPRADAYYQTSSYATIFNEVQDELDSYVVANVQVTLAPEEGNWFVRGFVQNITDNDVILGLSTISGQTSGNFSQGFLNEPRRWGIGLGFNF